MTTDNTLDPFALGGYADGDSRVLALFDDWLAASRDSDRHLDYDNDEAPEYLDAIRRLDEAEDAIIATPGGPAALAIKTYLMLSWDTLNNWAPAHALLRCPELFEDGGPARWAVAIRSIICDAARNAPVLAELVAPIIHEDAALIDAEIGVIWCQSVGPGCDDAEIGDRLAKLMERVAAAEPKTPRGAQIKRRLLAEREGVR